MTDKKLSNSEQLAVAMSAVEEIAPYARKKGATISTFGGEIAVFATTNDGSKEVLNMLVDCINKKFIAMGAIHRVSRKE